MNFVEIFNILSNVLLFEGAFLMIPYGISLIYAEPVGIVYLVISLICMAVGFLGRTFLKRERRDFYAQDGLITTALCWVLTCIIGALPMYFSGQYPCFVDCIFESVSGFTTTGAGVLRDVEVLAHCNLFWRSFTHWIGGMGVLVFLMSILQLSGSSNIHLMRAESPGPEVGKFVPRIRTTAGILYAIYGAFTAAEIVALMITGLSLFDAVCLTFSTVGTGGFGVLNSSIGSYGFATQVVIIVFMLLCSTNFYVYHLIAKKRFKEAFTYEESVWYLIIVGSAALLITWNLIATGTAADRPFHTALFTVSSLISTTGFTITDFDLWPQFSKWILILVMFIGGCAGSTGGGLKVSRVLILVKSVRNRLISISHPRSVKKVRLNGKNVSDDTLHGVLVYFAAYLIILLLSCLVVSLDNFGVADTFTSVLTCISNVGPGLGVVGPSGNFADFSALSKLVLSFDMLAGRLEIFALIVLFSPGTWRRN